MKFFDWIRVQIETWIEVRRLRVSKLNTCEACESKKEEILFLRNTINQLQNKILEKPEPVIHQGPPQVMTRPTLMSSRQMQNKLTQESKVRAKEIAANKMKEIESSSKLIETELKNG